MKLSDQIKAVGQHLIDNAEILADIPVKTTDFDIFVSFDARNEPNISVNYTLQKMPIVESVKYINDDVIYQRNPRTSKEVHDRMKKIINQW